MIAGFKQTKSGRPKGGGTGDCVVRSLANFHGWTYRHALGVVQSVSDESVTEEGLTLDRMELLASALGLAEVRFAADTPVVVAAKRLQDAVIMVDCTPAHIVASVGGVILDDRDSRFVPGIEEDPDGAELTFTRMAWISPFPVHRRKTCKSR